MSSPEEMIPIVDTTDQIIGYKKRSEITSGDIYRVSACRITDLRGDILLAQRSFVKKHHPGKRWPAVAGTVQQGETYLDNILKEIPEEIGVVVEEKDLLWWPKLYREEERTCFCQWFLRVYDGPKEVLIPEPGAVEQLRGYTAEELRSVYTSTPENYLESIGRCIEHLL